ncbi:ArsR/SmtB family transcription factor [Gorillibacterium massiliense]|uniref:ArsR/SmtB family transcription factor n=1 Tax=Gorillibacterium massiliense TaxID=1280390 RepID=UPI0004AD6EBB|nr:metalloregulator ArsR/SmtB family transcription factor [Gorillibacterium massiliense]
MDSNYQAYQKSAELLKALAHPVRLCIVHGLLQKGKSNVTYIQECLDLPQSTISQHLQKLRSLDIVRAERSGLEMIYSVPDERIGIIIKILIGEDSYHE